RRLDRSRGCDLPAAAGGRLRRDAGLGGRFLAGHLLGELVLARPLDLRTGNEELPAQKDHEREDDGDDEVTVVHHSWDLLAATCRRESSFKPLLRSATSRSN